MEDIEVGEYVRTKNGLIGKVNKIEAAGSGCRFAGEFLKDEIIQFNDGKIYERRCKRKQVIKHSFNIIDLIEVGDIVNKSKVYEIGQSKDGHKWVHTLTGFLYYEEDLEKASILTHEQYDSNCYKVE